MDYICNRDQLSDCDYVLFIASYRRKTGYAERINPFVTRENEIKIRADSSSEMRRGVLVHCVKNIRKVLLFIRKET